MALSEEETRLLEQMERALVHEDPKLAHTLRGTSARTPGRRHVAVAGVALLAGLGVLLAGAYLRIAPLGVVGFVIMLVGLTTGMAALARLRYDASQAAQADDPFGPPRDGRARHEEDEA